MLEPEDYELVTPCRTALAAGLAGKDGLQCRLALRSLRENERSLPSVAPSKKGKGSSPGRPPGQSKFSGQTIHALVEKNPRRPGTHGFKSFDIVLRAGGSIKYEDYKERGGRNNDLQWDIDHKYMEVK